MSNQDTTPDISSAVKTFLPSILRTVVPVIYALLVKWGVVSWIDPDDAFITNFLTILVTGVIYVLARLVETHWSWFGWLLGYAKQPVYVKGEVLSSMTDPIVVDNAATTPEPETAELENPNMGPDTEDEE